MSCYRLISFSLFLSSLLLLSHCAPRTEDAVYVLPDGFEGNAVVLFDQPSGAQPEYSAGYRVYRIPRSGILKSSFQADHGGFAASKFCYASRFRGIGPTPAAAYLPYVNALDPATTNLAPTTTVAFNRGGFGRADKNGEIFSVGRVAKADSLFEHREDLTEQALPPFPPEDSTVTSPRNP